MAGAEIFGATAGASAHNERRSGPSRNTKKAANLSVGRPELKEET